MLFLGTGAAELIPDPFCDCPVCADARRQKGIALRKRSSLMINERNLIDFGPEFAVACHQYDLDLCGLENIFITHTHLDHCEWSNLGLIKMSRKDWTQRPLTIYLSQKAYDAFECMLKLLKDAPVRPDFYNDLSAVLDRGMARIKPVVPYEAFEAGGMRILAVETNHRVTPNPQGEYAVNYRFELPNGALMLYASDTGMYPQRALDALAGTRLDILIMEATTGSNHESFEAGHLSGRMYIEMLKRFRDHGVIGGQTRVYATHINHQHDFTPQTYQAYFDQNAPQKVIIAHDGLRID